jgi:hypothetical protein
MRGGIIPLPHYASWRGVQLKKSTGTILLLYLFVSVFYFWHKINFHNKSSQFICAKAREVGVTRIIE